MTVRVQGRCPMGCGETLFLGSGGYVTCSFIGCPQPDAVSTILAEAQHHHVVDFQNGAWTVQHPLRDRVDGALFDCPATRALSALSGPPVAPGRYLMVAGGGTYRYYLLSGGAA